MIGMSNAIFGLALVVAFPVSVASGGEPQEPSLPAKIAESEPTRIDRLEHLVSSVVEENRRLSEEVRMLKEQLAERPPPPPSPTLPAWIASELDSADAATPSPLTNSLPPVPIQPSPGQEYPPEKSSGRFRVDYENGFAILPDNIDDTPFSLRVRSQNMFRYNGFARGTSFWTNSAGVSIPIANSSYFGIPRGRLIFSGTALLPRLSYLLNIDYNTVSSLPIGFRAYELNYRFSRGFVLSVGQNKVPGSREWLESAFAPLQSADRTMASTFFRPSLSQGVWITGQPLDGLYYHAMVSNGFNTLNLAPNRLNNRFCWSGSAWWEPWGDFGRGYSDFQHHEEPALRLGGSYTYAVRARTPDGERRGRELADPAL